MTEPTGPERLATTEQLRVRLGKSSYSAKDLLRAEAVLDDVSASLAARAGRGRTQHLPVPMWLRWCSRRRCGRTTTRTCTSRVLPGCSTTACTIPLSRQERSRKPNSTSSLVLAGRRAGRRGCGRRQRRRVMTVPDRSFRSRVRPSRSRCTRRMTRSTRTAITTRAALDDAG